MAENVLINPPNPTHQQHQQQQKPHHLVIPWSRILCNGPVWALGIAKFAYYYSFFMVVTWMPTYLGEMGMDEHTAAYASAIPFAVTCPAIIFFGWLAYHLTNHMEWRLVVVRKTFGTISFLANIGCFFALLFLKAGPAGDSTNAWTALIVFIVMYALNAPFIAGVAVNVLDIAAKYAGSVMALTHEFATGAGFLASVITGALVTERGRYERAFMVAIGVKKRKPTPHSIAPGSTAAAPFVIVQHPIWMVVDNDDVGGRGQRFAQCVKICLSTTREKTKTPSRVIFVVKFW